MSYKGDIDINYALVITSPGTVVHDIDNGYNYHNMFDAMVDSFYSALENAGARNVTVVMSKSGWPSAVSNAANASNSQIDLQPEPDQPRRTGAQGTPKRPGGIEAYIFAMFNVDQKLTRRSGTSGCCCSTRTDRSCTSSIPSINPKGPISFGVAQNAMRRLALLPV
jgi:hypothetical protein